MCIRDSFSTQAFSDGDVDKTRWGVEAALTRGPVKFQSEFITANFDGRGIDKDINTWYANVTWLITGESYAAAYKDGVFGRIQPNNNFNLGQEGWGAIELGLRYSKFDASDFKTMLTAPTATASYTSEVDAWTAGAKWIMNPNARILLNYVRTNFDTPIIINSQSSSHENALTMRAQYDF